MKSVSILGCGWLGKPLGMALIKRNYQVAGSTTRIERMSTLLDAGIKPFLIQLNPSIDGEHADTFFTTDVLIVSIPPKRKSGGEHLYVQQIQAMADAAKQHNIRHVIMISSTAVYTELNRVVTEEDADPTSMMVTAENQLLTQVPGKTTILRFGGLVGPRRHPGRFLSGKKDVPGASAPVNIIHLTDCIDIIVSLIEKNVGGVFNACAPHHPTKQEFYSRASILLGSEPPEFDSNAAVGFKVVSTEKLQRTLDYKFIFPDPLEMTFD